MQGRGATDRTRPTAAGSRGASGGRQQGAEEGRRRPAIGLAQRGASPAAKGLGGRPLPAGACPQTMPIEHAVAGEGPVVPRQRQDGERVHRLGVLPPPLLRQEGRAPLPRIPPPVRREGLAPAPEFGGQDRARRDHGSARSVPSPIERQWQRRAGGPGAGGRSPRRAAKRGDGNRKRAAKANSRDNLHRECVFSGQFSPAADIAVIISRENGPAR
jgi:hypothetical protein